MEGDCLGNVADHLRLVGDFLGNCGWPVTILVILGDKPYNGGWQSRGDLPKDGGWLSWDCYLTILGMVGDHPGDGEWLSWGWWVRFCEISQCARLEVCSTLPSARFWRQTNYNPVARAITCCAYQVLRFYKWTPAKLGLQIHINKTEYLYRGDINFIWRIIILPFLTYICLQQL